MNDMPEGQNSIYFVAADNKDAAEASPFLEKPSKRVLKFCICSILIDGRHGQLGYAQGKLLVDASKEALDLVRRTIATRLLARRSRRSIRTSPSG